MSETAGAKVLSVVGKETATDAKSNSKPLVALLNLLGMKKSISNRVQ